MWGLVGRGWWGVELGAWGVVCGRGGVGRGGWCGAWGVASGVGGVWRGGGQVAGRGLWRGVGVGAWGVGRCVCGAGRDFLMSWWKIGPTAQYPVMHIRISLLRRTDILGARSYWRGAIRATA